MSVAQPTPAEIKAAAAYLRGQGISEIAPRRLAQSAKELGKPLHDALVYLAHLLSGGQREQPAPKATAKIDRLSPSVGIGNEEPDYAAAS